ncbi:MAG: diguanylate cyclase [Thermaerobacter sp.]|nr:diguanylate cyclase [Thermaerobacter sp.]
MDNVLWDWGPEDTEQWTESRLALAYLYQVWVDMGANTVLREPTIAAYLPPEADEAWFRNHLLGHASTFLGPPTDPEIRDASRRVGFAHIRAHVPPSAYVSLYNLLFAAYHAQENDDRLPPLRLLRRRWLADLMTVLDTYTVVMDARIKELNDLALTDPLTGLLNRPGLSARIARDLATGVTHATFILLDRDHFKGGNDRHGHPRGDFILQQLAGHARTYARATDGLARMGGDEFAVWLPQAASPQQIHRQLRDFAREFGRDTGLGFSAGLAWYPHDGQNLETLYAAAGGGRWRARTRCAD